MRKLISTLPGVIDIVIGLVLIGWGGSSFVSPNMPKPLDPDEAMPLCPMSLTEFLGLESDGPRVQGLVAMGFGGMAFLLGLYSFRRTKSEWQPA
jgi:hypothetical protein